ncbi:MAG: dihydrolipoyllysine-residue acetyltransferase [Thermoleophilia bacterium]|nr:dihydrolipoyllysine-residue acetyltransferase [Thermoleophilia bacterium]
MATTQITVPDLGDFEDVPVIDVLVKTGDQIAVEDPLVTLESDKATMDVPATAAGTVVELKVSVGDTVSKGSVILTVDAEANGAAAAEDEATVDAAPSKPEPPMDDDRPAETREPAAVLPTPPDGPVYASPSVRRIARERGIDLTLVTGTGRKGRITVEDLQRFEPGKPAATAAPDGAEVLALAPWPQIDHASFGEVETVPLSRIKRISGPSLSRNWARIPHVTQFDEADITDLEAFRKQLNSEQDVKVTMLAMLIVASVATLKAFPDFNASLQGDELVLKRYYNIGFAADTEEGLLVPVIKDADTKGILEIAAEIRELAAKARDGKLKLNEMQGGTFTISSLGGLGGTYFTPIINAPEVAILGASRHAMKPVWDGEQFVPRLVLPLSLSYDHRAVDGAAGARFTTYLQGILSDFRRILL